MFFTNPNQVVLSSCLHMIRKLLYASPIVSYGESAAAQQGSRTSPGVVHRLKSQLS